MTSLFTRRKSGNGTAAKQDLYLLVCWPYVLIYKIGISKDAQDRARQVSREKIGTYFCVAVVSIEFAYHIEQLLLALTALFYWPFFGGREMRWGPLWVLLIPVYWGLFLLRYVLIVGFWLLLFYVYWKAHQ